MNFKGLIYCHSQKANVRLDKLISDFELLEIRNIIQELIQGDSKINYYTVILNDVINLIEFFIDLSLLDILKVKFLKEIIQKFQ